MYHSFHTMGFDWSITLSLHIDKTTGLPYVWGPGLERLPYKPEDYCVPERFRQFLHMRGHLFHVYTQSVEFTYECFRSSPADILQEWPSWEDVKGVEGFEDYDWSEEQHTLLKEALQWFSEHQFEVSWSY
jgi:hypothetical protein